MRTGRRFLGGLAVCVAVLSLSAPATFAAIPYARPGANTHDFTDLYLNGGETPSDLGGDGNTDKFAATPNPSNGPQINSNPVELNGVRGAHLDDSSASAQTAWMTTT